MTIEEYREQQYYEYQQKITEEEARNDFLESCRNCMYMKYDFIHRKYSCFGKIINNIRSCCGKLKQKETT